MSGAWCREHLVPPPNRRRGPLTTTEYELVEFDRSMTGQRAVYHAIVRTSEGWWRQIRELPITINAEDHDDVA
jgi:hypothetical protein